MLNVLILEDREVTDPAEAMNLAARQKALLSENDLILAKTMDGQWHLVKYTGGAHLVKLTAL